jgi:hypothetical protein
MAYPEEYGCGWYGEDGTVEDAANALIKRFGVGCYSDDLDSGHGLYCLALSTAFGIAKADDYAILLNAYPTKAVDLITEWEVQLGLNPWEVGLTLTERWTRITSRCTEIKGNNPAVLAVVFGLLVGDTVYVSECTAFVHGEVDRFEVAVILPISVWGTAVWDECVRVRDRIQHAHGRITLCVTHNSGAPHRHPRFRSDESLTDRDCTEPH